MVELLADNFASGYETARQVTEGATSVEGLTVSEEQHEAPASLALRTTKLVRVIVLSV